MPVSIQVSSWLRQQPGEAVCDECIGSRFLAARRRPGAHRLTSALATMTEFARESGTCRVCGAKTVVIRAV